MTRQAEERWVETPKGRLEGSRFGTHPYPSRISISSLISPNHVKTGGSRERSQSDDSPLSLTLLHRAHRETVETFPGAPVATFPSRIEREVFGYVVSGFAAKRLYRTAQGFNQVLTLGIA
jgi:hypothetical protein